MATCAKALSGPADIWTGLVSLCRCGIRAPLLSGGFGCVLEDLFFEQISAKFRGSPVYFAEYLLRPSRCRQNGEQRFHPEHMRDPDGRVEALCGIWISKIDRRIHDPRFRKVTPERLANGSY